MELDLVVVKNLITGEKEFFAVNDKHYDAMLAAGDSVKNHTWDWLGTVSISEEILNEQGYYFKEKE